MPNVNPWGIFQTQKCITSDLFSILFKWAYKISTLVLVLSKYNTVAQDRSNWVWRTWILTWALSSPCMWPQPSSSNFLRLRFLIDTTEMTASHRLTVRNAQSSACQQLTQCLTWSSRTRNGVHWESVRMAPRLTAQALVNFLTYTQQADFICKMGTLTLKLFVLSMCQLYSRYIGVNKTDRDPHPHGAHILAVTHRMMWGANENTYGKRQSESPAHHRVRSMVLTTVNKHMTTLCLGEFS